MAVNRSYRENGGVFTVSGLQYWHNVKRVERAMGVQIKGLGRGFDSLIPTDIAPELLGEEEKQRIETLPVDKIAPNPDQPRKVFDEVALKELASSIKQYGVLQPLVLVPAKTGKGYTIIAGERRWRASQLAGLKDVPVIIRSFKELEQLEVSLIENVQRVDLNPLEQAVSIVKLHEQFSLSYDEIAARLGKAKPTVSNIVRLLQLPEQARKALSEGKISEGHARAILALKEEPERQEKLLELILTEDWSVRKAEAFVKGAKVESPVKGKAAESFTQIETAISKCLGEKFNFKVKILRLNKGGKLIIRYDNEADLKKLQELL